MNEEALFMLRVQLDTAALLREGMSRRLPMRDVDLGYLVHAWLDGCLGPGAVRPFAIQDRAPGRRGARACEVLGYTNKDASALHSYADTFASPQQHSAADWASFAVKPMPKRFADGTRLGFEVTVCPTVRNAKRPGAHQRGAEVDAFLAACWRSPDEAIERADIYRGWLAARLERGGATLERCALADFRVAPMLRRTQGEQRKAKVKRFPRATLQGALQVTDGARFGALLRGGIGRHKAFGHGMLLLRPPDA